MLKKKTLVLLVSVVFAVAMGISGAVAKTGAQKYLPPNPDLAKVLEDTEPFLAEISEDTETLSPGNDTTSTPDQESPPDSEDIDEDDIADDEATETIGDDVDDVDEVDENGEDVHEEHPENHGKYVSEAAHSIPPGPEHGEQVREVAHSDVGKGGDNLDSEKQADAENSFEHSEEGKGKKKGGHIEED